jgi:hypothetical protein
MRYKKTCGIWLRPSRLKDQNNKSSENKKNEEEYALPSSGISLIPVGSAKGVN